MPTKCAERERPGTCHAERSEGSCFPAWAGPILRFAQNDTWRAVSFLIWVVAATAAPQAQAASAQDTLRQFVDRVQTFTADFEQVQKDDAGEVLQQSSGRVWLARPGKFRWSYEKPYDQLLVCDGATIWMYDPDLKQVTLRPAKETLAGTPAELLASRGALDEQFELGDGGMADGARIVQLKPKNPESDFSAIEIRFNDGLPVRMTFQDRLGTTSDIRFANARANGKVEEKLFTFDVPPGVDVIKASP